MCGILGVVGDHVGQRVSPEVFQAALDSITHRGPDAEGTSREDHYILGHRRLAIIDLSEGGAQPMVDEASGVSIVFNGEIYNYVELRDELRALGVHFQTQSDTEVLLKAYLTWGVDCLPKLNGMFAFACVDPGAGKLVLARDRFGVKPLYLFRSGPILAFASEVKALLGLGLAPREVDRHALADFIVAGRYATDARSFYKGIVSLERGQWMEYHWCNGSHRKGAYWEYPVADPSSTVTSEEAFEAFDELLTDAVRLRLRSDVPLAVSLSGGLDSTAILSASARLADRPPKCFTSTFDIPGSGELNWASIAAEAANAELIECQTRSDDWLEIYRDCIWHLDGPVGTPSVVPVWGLMKQVRAAGIKVLLEGQGADELLGGYAHYTVGQWADALAHPTRWAEAADIGLRGSRQFGIKSFFYHYTRLYLPRLFDRVRQLSGAYRLFQPELLEWGDTDVYANEFGGSDRSHVDRLLWLDHRGVGLSRLLHYGDALTMAHGIESRMPFMDYRLIDWAFRQPIPIRLDHRNSKWMIRSYLKKRNQLRIAQRVDKKGYPTPYKHWMSQMSEGLLGDLFPTDAAIFEYVRRDQFLQALRQQSGKRQLGATLLFRILSAQIWLDMEARA